MVGIEVGVVVGETVGSEVGLAVGMNMGDGVGSGVGKSLAVQRTPRVPATTRLPSKEVNTLVQARTGAEGRAFQTVPLFVDL